MNLGTEEEPRNTFISAGLPEQEAEKYVELLKENRDIFAWTYAEMPSLEPSVAMHRLNISKEKRPVKQAQRRFHPDLIPLMEEEVNQLIKVGSVKVLNDKTNAIRKTGQMDAVTFRIYDHMYFDGTSRASRASAEVIFITPQGDLLPYSFTLGAACTNNEAEYKALIIGMEIAQEMKIKMLQIFRDSKLIINQLITEFEIRKQELLPYCRKAQQLLEQFRHVEIKHVPRAKNVKADALASLITALSYPN
ncbi:uncharacterized protein LOC131249639 [Magnolia sinica]|uniref:uncharacterized protein LOC131249639 n=1 Tax=Magnolia sinica TaxID=86752 RepID=UPI00265963B1|nr:uncharacterized protein LOC131249639 [Magnolia sinica]